MAKKPIYEELEQRIKELEKEAVEYKRVEEELRSSEEQYKTLTNSSLTGIFIHQDERYVFVNDRFAKMHGYSAEELLGKEYKALIHPDDREVIAKRVSKRLKGESVPYQYEVQRLRKDGKTIWCEMIAAAIEYRGKSAVMGNIMDITQRKQAEKALRESEEMARALLNATTDAVVLLDSKGVILDVNETYAKRFQKSTDEMLGLCIWYLFPPGVTEARMANVKKVFETGKPIRMVDERQGMWNDTNTYPVYNFRGEVTRVAVFVRDITDRKRAEEHVHTLTQQLMKAQENERQRIARDLHDNVAQDLSLLKIGCETLFDGQPSLPVEIRQKASELSKILKRSITSVRDMAYDLHPPGLDQLGLASTIYQYCEEFAEKNRININFFAAGLDDLKIPFDTEINLYRLIQEALWNINKHADATRVTIKMVASFPYIILRIEDDGKGFDVKGRMAEAFAEKRMGLRSMEERVSLLNGKMRIKSRPTEGTKIFVEVPYKEKNRV
jgi:PAS domain S-box-containing protein